MSDTTGLNRSFMNDAAGRVLQKMQDGKRSHTLIANGEVVGSSDDSRFDSINTAYVPANTGATAPGSYTVQPNDTLQGIAKAVWGDPTLWYLIADANGLDDGAPLVAGQVINLPARPNAVHNNAATFKPYDASEAVGNTALNLPMPAGSDGCGGMGQIIMIAVAVAVTLYTAGALSGAAGSIGQVMSSGASFLGGTATAATETVGMSLGVAGTGAVAGAAGSIASQVVGNAIGAEDGFNWNQVALGAIAGGVAGGLSGWTPAGGNIYDLGNVVARTAVGSVMTQGIDVVTGLQDHFSWAAVAASAAGAGVSNGAAAGLQDTAFAHAFGSLGVGTLAGFAGGVVTAGLNGGRISTKQVATDAFGNTLGQSLAQQDWQSSGGQQTDKANSAYNGGAAFDAAYKATQDNPFYVPPAVAGVSMSAGAGSSGDITMGALLPSDSLTFAEDVAQRKAEFTPRVIITAPHMTEAQKLAFDFEQKMLAPQGSSDWIEENRASDQQHYRDWEANASNPVSAIMARYGSIANHAFYDLAGGAKALYQLATDPQAQINAVKRVGYALTHPGEVADALGNKVMAFANMQPGERAEAIMRAGLGGLATAGVGEVSSLTGRGLVATAEWVAPKAGQALETYMARSGGLAYMADAQSPSIAIDPEHLSLVTSHPDAHALARHGGSVTDEQLFVRAQTGSHLMVRYLFVMGKSDYLNSQLHSIVMIC
ncbi:MAG TPA: LysM domain-containing protein [Noviherbaspirillum sp.]